jgi:Ca2+-binding RTX toxin-like protein
VLATATVTLADFVEVLNLAGASGGIGGFGSAQANQLNGNNADNHLRGMGGNDSLSGAGGADTLEGGAGNDDYVVDSLLDVVIELAGAGTGTDILRTPFATVMNGALTNVENLLLTGGGAVNATGNNAPNNLTGNSAGNHLIGLNANDVLNGAGGADTLEGGANRDNLVGGEGNDLLIGGLLNDTLNGGIGNDTFRFSAMNEFGDRINDLVKNQDRIEIASGALGGLLPLGVLNAANFANNAATAAAPQFIYTKATGLLDYDSDGTGIGAAVNVAFIANKISLAASDIAIIA